MDRATFEEFRTLVYQRSGINLTPAKAALVRARIGKRIRVLALPDECAYLRHVMDDVTGDEVVQLLDAISTNVTNFFREADHFELLETYIKERIREGQSRIRLWSAACSSGEEPYTIAVTALEAAGKTGSKFPDIKILATDISTRVLDHARRGVYSEEALQPVPRLLRARYFSSVKNGGERQYHVKDEVRRLVTFRRLNLSSTPFPLRGPIDVIFCRNVMIYFDQATCGRIVGESDRLLRPGGYLLIGHSESLMGIPLKNLEAAGPSVYRKREPSKEEAESQRQEERLIPG